MDLNLCIHLQPLKLEVNAEARDDEEPFDREDILEYSQEFDEEKEFGTIGDDEAEVVIIHIDMMLVLV